MKRTRPITIARLNNQICPANNSILVLFGHPKEEKNYITTLDVHNKCCLQPTINVPIDVINVFLWTELAKRFLVRISQKQLYSLLPILHHNKDLFQVLFLCHLWKRSWTSLGSSKPRNQVNKPPKDFAVNAIKKQVMDSIVLVTEYAPCCR